MNLIEYYHDSGKMPDRYYYQLNGKTAEENYIDYKRKQQKKRAFDDAEVETALSALLEDTIQKLLKDLF